MALVECSECKEKMSDTATACPHCGYREKRDRPVVAFLKALAGAISVLVAVASFAFGVREYTKAQAWKRAEFVAGEYEKFQSRPSVRLAMQMLDWNTRDLALFPERDTVSTWVNDSMLSMALVPHVERPTFSTVEARIRDHFDVFFDGLESFDRHLQSGLVAREDLAPYLEYWLQIIGNERSGLGLYLRKFREIQVALDLERSYTKDQILEAYLNEIYMGRGFGFQNAARNYLGKNLADVNVAEAALLAAILNVPARYDPFRNPERAKARRDLVLNRMAEQGYLTREEADGWKEFPLPEAEPEGVITSVAPYFEEWVRRGAPDPRTEAPDRSCRRSGRRLRTTADRTSCRSTNQWAWWRPFRPSIPALSRART